MKSKPLVTLIVVLLVIFGLSQAPLTRACGPFSLSAVFSFSVHPEYPLERFAAGELGVVQPSYARSYLYVAYRHFAGGSFSEEEQKSVVSLWRDRLDLRWPEQGGGIEEWQTARKRVESVTTPTKIEVYRSREKPNEYETYLNCQDGAFRNAAATLNARIDKFGASNPLMTDWVAAQDQVFANCSEGKHIPAPAPADADLLIKNDRTYQLAAANFYAGDFAAAKDLFAEISRDKNSVWQPLAPYLLARTFVREASLTAPEKKSELLSEAEKQLNAILKSSASRQNKEDAQRLLDLVRLRLHPEARTHELAQSLISRDRNEALKQELWDYTVLLDELLGDTGEGATKEVSETLKKDELTDWITTFQSDKVESREYSIQKFLSTSSLPWLVAALAKVDSSHPQTPQLAAAAARVNPSSPAFPSAFFHLIRLKIEAGRFDEARTTLDDVLKNHRNRLTVSGANLVISQRLLLATNLEDFLTHAQRQPAALSYDDDGREIPDEEENQSDGAKKLRGKPLFDHDAVYLLNQKFPLELLEQAANSQTLSENLRRDVAQAAWLRAVLLGDVKTAEALVPTVKSLIPELTPMLDEYVSAQGVENKKFTAIYTWLKFPGLEPVVDFGIGRESAMGEQDAYRDNWWCGAAYQKQMPVQDQEPAQQKLKVQDPFEMLRAGKFPLFLTAAQRTRGERQFATLSAFGAAPNYLCREAIQWATRNGADPRAPEALHLAVKTTRYGCTDTASARWSKSAFDFLHRRYPRSVWAKRTPYWFKD